MRKVELVPFDILRNTPINIIIMKLNCKPEVLSLDLYC